MNYIYIAAGIALVGANIGWMAERNAHAETKATHAEYIATAERTARALSDRNRTTEQELRNAQYAHATQFAAAHRDLDRARAAASATGKRLQDAANAAAARARDQCANPTTPDLGTPAGDTIGVLADVLGRADARAGELADIAEQRGIAGRACEREYDALRALNR